MSEFMNEFLSIWSELSVGGKIRVGLTIFSFLVTTGGLVTLVWKLIPKNRWGYRLVSVPVTITLWLGLLVWGINEGERQMLECMDTWAYQHGGRAC